MCGIIKSLVDNDLYSFSVQQCVLHQFPDVIVKYEFKLRNYSNGTFDYLLPLLNDELNYLCHLRFDPVELAYLKSLPWFKSDYIEYLRLFQLNRDYIRAYVDESGEFRLTIEGPWVSTILFEVPVLAIVSELFSHNELVKGVVAIRSTADFEAEGQENLDRKIKLIQKANQGTELTMPTQIKIVDFGTRRRFSKSWQDYVVGRLVEELPKNFIGTSNVYFARKYGIKPIGTMSHQLVQSTQGMKNVRLSESQKYAFEVWAKEYRGDLGIALSDCLGMDAFFRDFDKYLAKLYDGARHDSGDPYVWCDKLIAHYKSMGIDPKTKTAVFSDNLNFTKALEIYNHYHGQINMSFGIGTNITNDTGFKAPQIVIKMTECNGNPVAKISDSKGKMMCKDPEFLKYLAHVFKIPMVWEE